MNYEYRMINLFPVSGQKQFPESTSESEEFVNPFEFLKTDVSNLPSLERFRVKRNPLRPYQIYRMYQRSFL